MATASLSFGNSWRQRCRWNHGFCRCVTRHPTLARLVQIWDPKELQQLISQALDDGMGWLLTFFMQFTLNTPPVARPTRCCFAPPFHERFQEHTDLRTCISVTLVPSACTRLFRQIVASFVDMVFPDAINTPFSSLWPLGGSEEASLGDTPDTHGPLFSPCSELLRSLARQFHSAAILQRYSSKIVLF